MSQGQIGCIVTPAEGKRPPEGALWCADNGCGPSASSDGTMRAGAGYPGDVPFLAWLAGLQDVAGRCVFAVAPDVVGDAAATLTRSRPFLPVIRALGFKAALAAQNGLESLRVPWDDFDALFIGGDDAWKLGPHAQALAAEARLRGKWVHLGRVNSLKRMRYGHYHGCDSGDGTYLTRGPDTNLPKALAWQRVINDQGVLWSAS